MSVFYLLLLLLLFTGVRVAPAGKFFEDASSYESCLPLRGFFMLLIVFHHLSQQLTHPGSLKLLQGIGPLCVSFFFLLSGYGLMKKHLQNPGYFHAFFRRRYTKLFIPFITCNLIFLCVNLALGTSYTPWRFLKCLVGLELVNTHAWFVLTIALFYLAFYLIFRFVKRVVWGYVLLFIFQLSYSAFCMHQGSGFQLFEGPWWFNSSILFFIGVLLAGIGSRLISFFKEHYRLLTTLSVPLFLFLYIVSVLVEDAFPYQTQDIPPLSPRILRSWFTMLWQSLAAVSFCLMIVLFTLKLKCSNRALHFLGTISLELYLIHGLFIQLFKGQLCTIQNDYLFITAVLICSVLSACALYYPVNYLTRWTKEELEKL